MREVICRNEQDAAQMAAWVDFCVAHPGRLPPDVDTVQARLVRAVGRGRMPSGAVAYLKVMGFPRRRDRVRYWLRSLPAQHEAAMLRATTAAGVACPAVLAVAGARGTGGCPRASVLATAALDLLPDSIPRLSVCSGVASRLADAGIVHADLHEQNFIPLASGECAVLDLQSARLRAGPVRRGLRVAMAGRLLAADWRESEVPDAVVVAGLIERSELADALSRAQHLRAAAIGRRVRRCMMESTDFCVFHRAWGHLIQRRALPPGGTWLPGGRELIRAWVGARFCEVVEHESPQLGALFLNSWWLPSRCSVYIPEADGVARFAERCSRWLDAYHRFKNMTGGGRRGPTLSLEAVLPWSGKRES